MTMTSPTHPAATEPAAHLTHAVALLGGVRGALRSGLLEALWRWHPCTAAELATRSHLPVRTVELTLGALAIGGVVAADDADRWTLTAPPESWAMLVGFEENICRFVETGTATRADGDDRYTGVLPIIGRFHERIAEQVAPMLTRADGSVLEIGAGTAPWSRALLSAEPTMQAVAVDLPPVVAQLARSLAHDPVGVRIELRAQDVRSLRMTERFDVVVVSGLCRLLGAADNAQLFRRCLHLLAAGGRLVVCDAFAGSPDPDGSLALYELGLAARSHAETLWTATDYERWLRDAGFAPAETVLTGRAGVTVLVASDPRTHLSSTSTRAEAHTNPQDPS